MFRMFSTLLKMRILRWLNDEDTAIFKKYVKFLVNYKANEDLCLKVYACDFAGF